MLTAGDNADCKSEYELTPVSKYSLLPLTPFRPEAPVRRKREHPVTLNELQQNLSGGNCLLRLRATSSATMIPRNLHQLPQRPQPDLRQESASAIMIKVCVGAWRYRERDADTKLIVLTTPCVLWQWLCCLF